MSSRSQNRAALLAALEREMRWNSALSVLFSQVVADRAGMHPTDLEALDILNLMGAIPAGRLAELTGLTTGSATSLIDRLEAAGCVARERDPADRRRVIVRPLPMPEPLARQIGPAFASMVHGMDELYARYSDAELALILAFVAQANEVGSSRIAEVRGSRAPKRDNDEDHR